MSQLHLFYLSSEGLDAWLWSGGALSHRASFAPGRAGVDAFIDYLEPYGATPAYVLADLVEEDFQRLLLPHVGGKAGRNLLARRLQQQYRETPYRRATIQGRADEGRRDDVVLLSALTNPALLQPWTEAMELLKAPLGGLYSASMLGTALVRTLDLRGEDKFGHLLLVTRQSAGLRQSYFLDGQLKFSRLTPSVDRDGDAVNVAVEVARTQQFLTSSRLLERGVPLDAVLLAPEADLAALAQQCKDGPETSYHFIPMTEAAKQAGMDAAPALADGLLLHLLGDARPASHYPLGAEGRYYRFWRARVSLYASSLVLAASALAWMSVNLWGYAQASSAAAQLAQETSRYDAQYRAAMAPMPPTLAPTADMKAAVTVDRLLAAQAPRPLEMLSVLSMALDRAPQIQIVSLDWRVGDGAGAANANAVPGLPADPAMFGPGADGAPVTTPIPSRLLGIPQRAAQTLRVEAEVRPAHNGYRDVVNSMNQLAQDLARMPGLSVAIERPALDMRPEVKLSGKADMNEPAKPHQFVLNLVQRP
ncbi:hypothetical protein [Pseudoduganella namucuonensis]|uniref:hypothetical protein n=1 Tax=Pseudoduganella namucuonensis TaxID=1035707 RepID=UPI000B895E3E|nr:hypothetical protein [Pseudoduganella namucuonensis]